jgi:hypothetical protein
VKSAGEAGGKAGREASGEAGGEAVMEAGEEAGRGSTGEAGGAVGGDSGSRLRSVLPSPGYTLEYKLIWPYLSKHPDSDQWCPIFVIPLSTHHMGDTVGTMQIIKTTKQEVYLHGKININQVFFF